MINLISHIGIVVEDLDAAVKTWTGVFGFKKYSELEIAVEGIRSVFLSVGGTADEMTIELMEPLDQSDLSNAVARRLAKSGEGVYHLAVEVADVQSSGRSLEERGLTVLRRPATSDKDAPRWLVHPKDANGVMIEGLAPR
jgi:methylmalonyl-CoA/ethylmalonyl-CoA epimerase